MYGEPIYVKEDATPEELAQVKDEVKTQLLKLETVAPKIYNEAKKQKRWKKKKQ